MVWRWNGCSWRTEHDVTLELSRDKLQELSEGLCSRITALVRRAILSAFDQQQTLNPVDVVEIVGGGTRIPCVANAIQAAAGG